MSIVQLYSCSDTPEPRTCEPFTFPLPLGIPKHGPSGLSKFTTTLYDLLVPLLFLAGLRFDP